MFVPYRNYSNPAIPDVKGSNIFRGKIMHSHSYRDPNPFKGNSVLVIGCGASGLDISFGVSSVAEKVNVCLNFSNINCRHDFNYVLGFIQPS